MPSTETIITAPGRQSIGLSVRELVRYRDLLYFLTVKNFIIKYKQTLIGVIWAVIQPAMQMVVFSIIFGRLAKIPSDNVPYPIFVYSALIPWTFFANSMSACNNSIINHAGLISKVYFPRLLIPLSAIGSQLIDFGISFILLVGIMIYYGFPFTTHLVMTVPLILLTVIAAVGFGAWIAGLSGIYRDFRHIVPFLLSIWMFLTPVIYPVSLIGSRFEFLLNLNPLTGIVSGFRSAVLNQPFQWNFLFVSLIGSMLIFIIGIGYFHRAQNRFADLV
ncbi:MAG: ABC transporter permease [Fidelibacterota bacterium]